MKSPKESRPGARSTMRTCPPRASSRSSRITSCPRPAATRATSRPAGPPPATTTRRDTEAGRFNGSHSSSCPTDGLTEQTGRWNIAGVVVSMDSAMQRLQPMHRRIAPKRPVRALLANSGSAIPARVMPTRSHMPFESRSSAMIASLMRPAKRTGTGATSARMARPTSRYFAWS